MRLPDHVYATVVRLSAPYADRPVPDGYTMGAILNAIAWTHRDEGWGLSRKTSGKRVDSPVGEIAEDILHHRPTGLLYDIWIGADVGRPLYVPSVIVDVGPPQSPDRVFVAPVQPVGVTPIPPGPVTPTWPPPTPTPVQPVCRVSEVMAELSVIKAQLAGVLEVLEIVIAGQATLGGDVARLTQDVQRLAEGFGPNPHHLLGHLDDIKHRVSNNGVPSEPFR